MIKTEIKDLSLRQRDVLIELCNTNDGSAFLYPDEPNFGLKLKAAKELAERGIVAVDESDKTEINVAITAEGEAWLLSQPEGAFTADLND